jgi:type I restriction enzyme M protein
MEQRLERNWKRIMALLSNNSDPDIASLSVFLLSFNYKQPVVFSEMKRSLLHYDVEVNSFLKDIVSKFCYEAGIDNSLERVIINLVKGYSSLIREIILSWDLLVLSEKDYDKAFDYIFEKINSFAGKFGAFSTSDSLRKLIQELTPKDSFSALDPACGSGSLLVDFLSNGGQRAYGQDINSSSLNYARLRFLDKPNVNLSLGDSLTSELFDGQKIDLVLCNPPFNLKIGNEQQSFINNFFGEGLNRLSSINLAWVKLGLHYLNEGGTGIFVLPVSSLFNPPDTEIRKQLVDSGQLQAILSLPGNLLLYTSIPVCIWVVNKRSVSTQRGILLIDALSQAKNQGRTAVSFDNSIISEIGSLIKSFRDGGVLSTSNNYDFAIVSQEEVRSQDYQLQPNRFLEWPEIDGPNLLEYKELGSVLSRPSFIKADVPQVGVKTISVQNLSGSLSRTSINYKELNEGGKRPIFLYSDHPILLIARIGKRLKPTILSNYQFLAFDFVNVFYYEVDTSKVILEFLIIELEQPYVLAQIDRLQTGSTIPSLRRNDLESLRINIPSLEEQKKIVDEEKQRLVRVAEKELQSLTEKIGLERADANSFLRHKIAGPLRNLRGAFSSINVMLEMHVVSQYPEILDKKVNDKRTKTFKDYLKIFERDLEKVTKLINQSSDEYAIENKSLEEVELISFIKDYVGDIEGSEKGVNFKLFIDKDVLDEAEAVDIVILSNWELLSDLLDNLVRNAVMHGFKGFEGKKEIHFTILPILVENSLKVNLNVSNSGNPVGSSFTIELFSKQGAKAGDSDGDGFGLWYVREIMKKHNGELKFTNDSKLESDTEKAMVSTFKLIFPIKELKNNGEI